LSGGKTAFLPEEAFDLFDPKVCLLFFTITLSTLTKPKTPHVAGVEKSILSIAAIFQQWK